MKTIKELGKPTKDIARIPKTLFDIKQRRITKPARIVTPIITPTSDVATFTDLWQPTDQVTTQKSDYRYTPQPTPTTPPFVPSPPVLFGLGITGRPGYSRKKKKKAGSFAYTPTLVGMQLGKFLKVMPSKKTTYTGAEIRLPVAGVM